MKSFVLAFLAMAVLGAAFYFVLRLMRKGGWPWKKWVVLSAATWLIILVYLVRLLIVQYQAGDFEPQHFEGDFIVGGMAGIGTQQPVLIAYLLLLFLLLVWITARPRRWLKAKWQLLKERIKARKADESPDTSEEDDDANSAATTSAP